MRPAFSLIVLCALPVAALAGPSPQKRWPQAHIRYVPAAEFSPHAHRRTTFEARGRTVGGTFHRGMLETFAFSGPHALADSSELGKGEARVYAFPGSKRQEADIRLQNFDTSPAQVLFELLPDESLTLPAVSLRLMQKRTRWAARIELALPNHTLHPIGALSALAGDGAAFQILTEREFSSLQSLRRSDPSRGTW